MYLKFLFEKLFFINFLKKKICGLDSLPQTNFYARRENKINLHFLCEADQPNSYFAGQKSTD